MTELSSTEAQATADLGRLSTKVEPFPLSSAADPLVVVRVRHDEQISVTDLEEHLSAPLQPRGHVALHDHKDFAAYVNRLATPGQTTVWADVEQRNITAVLNDHEDHQVAGWRDHRVTLQLRLDADWVLWNRRNGTNALMSQAAFAEHLEEMAHTIVEPSAADLMEVAKTFQAKKSVDFSEAVRLDNGDVQLSYAETTTAKAGTKGHMEIPSEFTLALAPFIGGQPVAVTARLRYRIEGGRLGLGYVLHRPDLVLQAAFDNVLADVRAELITESVFNGTAPKALRAQR